jgi:uncharacterized membrane protein
MEKFGDLRIELHETEERLLTELRTLRRGLRQTREASAAPQLTIGQRIADAVAATMGSWTFIIIQSVTLMFWIALNVTAYVQQWDPYPFILLNLALSFQAAYAAPFIMMSQNRQQDIDRKSAEHDYQINIKAELEIELLHQKIDQLRETEVLHLTEAVNGLTALLSKAKIEPGPPRSLMKNRRGSNDQTLLVASGQIGIGGSLAAPPLPHHRTYGSVYGGSAD